MWEMLKARDMISHSVRLGNYYFVTRNDVKYILYPHLNIIKIIFSILFKIGASSKCFS